MAVPVLLYWCENWNFENSTTEDLK